MKFLVAACTDTGNHKTINQDSINVMIADTCIDKVAMITVCDGIGGLSSGEVASAKVVLSFKKWFVEKLPLVIQEGISIQRIEQEWNELINNVNESILSYAVECDIKLGTTLTAALFAEDKYYIVQIGDSRAYEINSDLVQITKDQTLTAREQALGNITLEQAKHDNRRHVLLQCIGTNTQVKPEFYYGNISNGKSYLVCTDGFYNKLENYEILQKCSKQANLNQKIMEMNLTELISLNKSRGERDNISAVLLQITD